MDLVEIGVAVVGAALVVLAVRRAKSTGWAGSLQLAAVGLLLVGASAVGVVGFVAGIVLNPLTWFGIAALGIAAVLFGVGQKLEGRPGKRAEPEVEGRKQAAAEKGREERKPVEGRKSEPAMDEDMAEIEEILRRHGIE